MFKAPFIRNWRPNGIFDLFNFKFKVITRYFSIIFEILLNDISNFSKNNRKVKICQRFHYIIHFSNICEMIIKYAISKLIKKSMLLVIWLFENYLTIVPIGRRVNPTPKLAVVELYLLTHLRR